MLLGRIETKLQTLKQSLKSMQAQGYLSCDGVNLSIGSNLKLGLVLCAISEWTTSIRDFHILSIIIMFSFISYLVIELQILELLEITLHILTTSIMIRNSIRPRSQDGNH